jgi:riboflavin kinase
MQLTFEGTVFSGRGEGKRFVALPWVMRQIQEKLGFTPYAGTLNIRLTEESTQKRRLLEESEGIAVVPKSGFCPGVLYKAQLDKEKCAVVLPKTADYPRDVLEVIAPRYLREELGLGDGSAVAVAVWV